MVATQDMVLIGHKRKVMKATQISSPMQGLTNFGKHNMVRPFLGQNQIGPSMSLEDCLPLCNLPFWGSIAALSYCAAIDHNSKITPRVFSPPLLWHAVDTPKSTYPDLCIWDQIKLESRSAAENDPSAAVNFKSCSSFVLLCSCNSKLPCFLAWYTR